MLLSTLALSNSAGSSASVDATTNRTMRYNKFIDFRKTILVPENYTTIQEAINKAEEGDTIEVSSGIYYENLALNKTVNLIGKDANTTILDGRKIGNVADVTVDNVVIDGFTIRNSEIGINLLSVGNCLIRRNIIKSNQDGINIASCWKCIVTENNVSNNRNRGMYIGSSHNCSIEDNIVEKNEGYALNLYSSWNCSIVGNIVRGGITDWDAIGLYSCTDCVVIGNTANDSHLNGIWLESSKDCLVEKNYVNNNMYGIAVHRNSTRCIIRQNDVRNSRGYNLFLYSSDMNTFYHNNFIATGSSQVESTDSVNKMDNGVEGNYWSNYVGIDNNCDGIGDTVYVVDADEHDDYPLMARFTNFSINRENETHDVNIISNSTVSNFEFNTDKNEVKFQVSGEKDTYGFCRISIPKALMDGTLVIKVDSGVPIIQKKLEPLSAPLNYLYFTYTHSTHQVTITLEVHQDFLSQILMPLLLVSAVAIVALVLFVVRRKRFNLSIRRKK